MDILTAVEPYLRKTHINQVLPALLKLHITLCYLAPGALWDQLKP
jgi:hypothetical protein